MCVWLFVQTTLIQTINVCITLSILRAHIYIKIALRMLTIFASIPIIQSRHHYNFFFREDEAISLFFKNSSMSCKKLNNIWYCRFAILEIQNITEKDLSEFPRPTTFKRLWLLQKFLWNNFSFFEFHCFPMVCAFHYFTYLDQTFLFYLQFGCPTANFGPLWKAASLAWG